jgi:hypothetical protein
MLHFRSILRILAPALAACAAFPACGHAGAGTPPAGEYLSQESRGVLTLSRSAHRAARFSIHDTGANGHVCKLAGVIRDGRASLDIGEPGRSCVVTFARTAEGIDVGAVDPGACLSFCGMRAHFEHPYFLPRPGCTRKEVGAARARFKGLYAAKSYARAAAVLAPLLTRCSKTLGEAEWVRNDLAVTQVRLGRLADCRKTLAPLAEDAARTDEELRRSLPPFDFQVYLPAVQATRHNLKLCAQGG